MLDNLNRRNFLGKSITAAGAAGLFTASSLGNSGAFPIANKNPGSKPDAQQKTILAIGAHYDDLPFGISGILLDAVQKNYRVVILNIIGDYSNWAPVRDRVKELRANSIRLASERGMEMRFLSYASMQFEVNDKTKREMAEVVAEVQPELAFMLWRRDRHPDHEVAALLSEAALRQPGAILGRPGIKIPKRIYYYDNGPGHTVNFEPDTFVDVSAHWPAAMEWLGRNMAFVRKQTYDPMSPDGSQDVKKKLALYRGMTCGVEYAEALMAYKNYPEVILR